MWSRMSGDVRAVCIADGVKEGEGVSMGIGAGVGEEEEAIVDDVERKRKGVKNTSPPLVITNQKSNTNPNTKTASSSTARHRS